MSERLIYVLLMVFCAFPFAWAFGFLVGYGLIVVLS